MSAMVRDALDAYIAIRTGGSDGSSRSSLPEEHSAPRPSMSGADASSDTGYEADATDE